MKIAFFDTKPYDRLAFDRIKDNYPFTIKYFEHKLDEDTVELTKGYEVVCAFVNDTINRKVVAGLYQHGVRLIAMRCAGYNNVDFEACYNKIHIVRVPAYSPYAVAEHAFALVLALNRKTHKAYNRTRESNFNITGLTGFDLYGKTIGIIGMGKIGQIMADIGRGFGMSILAYDKFPTPMERVEYVDLEQLYQAADIISLHCPLLKETHHIINAQAIAQMKPGVMIINTSRGGLIDSESLIEGIKNRQIGSAGLDVYEEESEYFFEDFSNEIIKDDVLARLLSFNNVLVTSHQAFLTREALANISETTLENINAYYLQQPLPNEICYACDKTGRSCRVKQNKPCFE